MHVHYLYCSRSVHVPFILTVLTNIRVGGLIFIVIVALLMSEKTQEEKWNFLNYGIGRDFL